MAIIKANKLNELIQAVEAIEKKADLTKRLEPIDGVRITLTLENPDGCVTYVNTPVDDKPESLRYHLSEFIKKWEWDKKYL